MMPDDRVLIRCVRGLVGVTCPEDGAIIAVKPDAAAELVANGDAVLVAPPGPSLPCHLLSLETARPPRARGRVLGNSWESCMTTTERAGFFSLAAARDQLVTSLRSLVEEASWPAPPGATWRGRIHASPVCAEVVLLDAHGDELGLYRLRDPGPLAAPLAAVLNAFLAAAPAPLRARLAGLLNADVGDLVLTLDLASAAAHLVFVPAGGPPVVLGALAEPATVH